VTRCCPVVELRQYTLYPGQRDVLIDLFDAELVEPQEAAGMHVIGQFRDLDRPDRFVWVRGFADMDRRRESLASFYGGPVWRAHRATANATMIDSDDVLLLRPVRPASAFEPLPPRPGPLGRDPASTVVVTICSLDQPADPLELDQRLLPTLAAASAPAVAVFVEESAVNTFPALPVRDGEHVVVWLQRVEDWHQVDPVALEAGDAARSAVRGLSAPPVHLRLEPTARSALR
jgi:hypothetical protein